jgi:hypothetical protein
MIRADVLDEPAGPRLPGMLPMGWLGQTAMAIAASDAPEREFDRRPAELAAAGAARLGDEEIRRRAAQARALNLAATDPRDVGELAATRQRISDLWGSAKRMRAAYDAAWWLAGHFAP